MCSPQLGLRVASLIFGLVGLGHLLRLLLHFQIVIGSHYVQQRWSLVAALVCGALCAWLWMLTCKTCKSESPTPPEQPKQ